MTLTKSSLWGEMNSEAHTKQVQESYQQEEVELIGAQDRKQRKGQPLEHGSAWGKATDVRSLVYLF